MIQFQENVLIVLKNNSCQLINKIECICAYVCFYFVRYSLCNLNDNIYRIYFLFTIVVYAQLIFYRYIMHSIKEKESKSNITPIKQEKKR
jgi:hypothetical protein